MAARRDGSDGLTGGSRVSGVASGGSPQPAAERVHVTLEVVEPLLRRADLLSQLLWIGYGRDSRSQ